MLTSIILVLIGSLFNTEMDKISFYPKEKTLFPNWEWWHKHYIPNQNWWLKVPFSMFSDGWHFCKFIFMMCWIFAISIHFSYIWYYQIIISFGMYISRGLLHEFWLNKG